MTASPVSTVDQVDTPAALIERGRLEANLTRMQQAAAANGVSLRPHAKTHKAVQIARRQRELGAVGHTVAKLDEAEALVAGGLDDVFVCYPIVGEHKLERLFDLAGRARILAAVDSHLGVETLDAAARERNTGLEVVIEVDTGLDRAGVPVGPSLKELAAAVRQRSSLRLAGIATHEGYAYSLPDPVVRERTVRARLEELASAGKALGVPTVSSGATPSVLQTIDVPGITEVRPGNYVFYDAMQVALGSATIDDCALTVLTTVVEVRSATRAIVDAGSKALSSDAGVHGLKLLSGYGSVLDRDDMKVGALSEEHGWLELDEAGPGVSVGDLLRIVPNHACATMANFSEAHLVDGEQVVESIAVSANGASR
jgi:D-serine deaminase-like pyridoxal phosphate-dependent protein